jgi:serine-type D-Ala-D-Ala carboxypeptidase (penicillin-binding protein 5/6)
MYGPLFSVLFMGMVPVWGAQGELTALSSDIHVAPPTLAASARLSELDTRLTASGAIVIDLDSGQTVYSRNVAVPRPMASLTKLMTALIIVENHELDEVVKVPPHAAKVIGTTAHLPPNDRFTVGDLLSALLIMSANDAALTLAEFHSGSIENFVADMNVRAKELGLKDTSYKNPIGLDEPSQQSSPRDLAWLAMYIMRDQEIASRMGTAGASITSLSGKTLTLTHTHQLLLQDDPEILAGKTGTTDAAGQCLLSIVQADGRKYVVILLHSKDRYADMRRVIETLSQ